MSGRALVLLTGLLLCLQTCADDLFMEPMPTQQDCPECGFAQWRCNAACSSLLSIEFNFTHEATGCFEAIPANDRTLFWDTDAYCIFPESEEKVGLNCDTMEKYALSNPYVLFLDECQLQSGSSITVAESCHWTCKAERPYYRCKWTFDPEGKFDHNKASTLEKCWLKETCTSQWTQQVEAVCRPMDIWTEAGLSQQEADILKEQLKLMGDSHAAATQALTDALAASGLTQADINAAWAKYNATVKQLAEHSEAMQEAGELIDGDTTDKVEYVQTTIQLRGVEYIQLVAADQDPMQEAIKHVLVSTVPDIRRDDVKKVEFSRGSMVVKVLVSAPSAVVAAQLQIALLGRANALAESMVAELQTIPTFTSMAVGPVSVGSVDVVVVQSDGNGEKLDLSAEVDKYKRKFEKQKQKTENAKEKVGILIIVVALLGGLVVFLCAAVIVLCIMRKRSSRVCDPASPTETNLVVIGRPCEETDQGTPTADAKGGIASTTGLFHGSAAANCVTAVPLRPSAGGSGLKGLDV